MNLNEHAEVVNFPEIHYVFVERVGLFMENAQAAWQQLHSHAAALSENNRITGGMALYKMGPKVYRAGFSIAGPPVKLPDGLKYERFHGGKYLQFELTGPYSDLPAASGRVWAIVGEKKIELRDDYAVENYMNDPKTTAPANLITHIMVPMV